MATLIKRKPEYISDTADFRARKIIRNKKGVII